MMKRYILPFLILFLFTACNKNKITQEPKPIHLSDDAAKMVQADNRFGFDLFRKAMETDSLSENRMISPLSVSLCLTMVYNGASGTTKAAFDSVLHYKEISNTDINKSAKELMDALTTVDKQVTFEIANAIWYHTGLPVNENFISTNKKYLDAEVAALDFNDPASVTTINDWVNKKTHGKINKIIDRLNEDEMMALINALYFKGDWRFQFKKSNTAKENFHKADGTTVQVDMMKTHEGNTFSFYHDETIKLVEMPYGRGNFSMVAILPVNGSLNGIIPLLTPENWDTWLDQAFEVKDIHVEIPKFEFQYKLSLSDILKIMGLSVAFSDQADFSGISEDVFLKMSRVIHKTYIKTDEEGTEAAAVTYSGMANTSFDVNEFIADKPFFFAIREKFTGAILFAGIINDPNNNGN